MSAAGALVGGVAVDRLLGDPRRGHPVAGFGTFAGALESRLYAPRPQAGALVAALAIAGAALPVVAADRMLGGRALRGVFGTAVVWSCLGGRSLWVIGDALAARLEAGDLDGARALLPSLAGRDPSQLDASGIARAATESIAENTADAVLGTLVWGAALGPAGAAIHRASNTLDAMHGHRSPRYERFGMPAARLDDVLGFVPARVGAWLAVVLTPLVRRGGGAPEVPAGQPAVEGGIAGRPMAAARVVLRDGRNHPSPNAGPMEAAFAGAVGVRLGGPLTYGDRAEVRGTLNVGGRDPDARGLRDAVRLSRAVSHATLAGVIAARLGTGWFGARMGVETSPRRPGRRAGSGVGWFGARIGVETSPRRAGGGR